MSLSIFKPITEKPLESLMNPVPKFHIDLLSKVFIPVAADQGEFRIDCRILMVKPGGKDRYHFHKHTVNAFTVVQGEIDVVFNDEKLHLKVGESVIIDALDKHSFVNDGEHICVLTETRLNVHENDVFYCEQEQPQGQSTTRFES